MRQISWLHISDFHMRVCNAWSQDVVLQAMCEQIEQQRAEGTAVDFILVTGDMAFSGMTDEYALVVEFLDALSAASGVSKKRIFCVPGNHDINRDRQKFCFLGARESLQDQNHVDAILAGGEDLEMLIKRQQNYRQFQKAYFADQNRTSTEDSLGYVAWLMVDEIRLAIIGLDSAWLAEGGMDDHGKLLVGERQVINALRLVKESKDPAHIIVAMVHHPFHLLQEFDRRTAMERIERVCHFLHYGHLHEPEARTTGPGGAGCLTLAAGASFETRQSCNSYSVITLDLLNAVRTVKIFQYNPTAGSFSFVSPEVYRIEVTPADTCNISELAAAMKAYAPEITPWIHYLSALLLDRKAELPIPTENGHTFASFSVLQEQSDNDLKRKTADFMKFKNALRVLYRCQSLSEIFAQYGTTVTRYGAILRKICDADAVLRDRLSAQEKDSQTLATMTTGTSFSYTNALFSELADKQEWDILREQSRRHLDSPDTVIAVLAKRMLALSLAHSDKVADQKMAIELYQYLVSIESVVFSDAGHLATLLIDVGNYDDAKGTVLEAITKFPAKVDYFAEIGQRIVKETGDKEFRKQIETAITERGKGD